MKQSRMLLTAISCCVIMATTGCGPQGSDSTEDIDQDKTTSKDSTRYPGRNSDPSTNDDTSHTSDTMNETNAPSQKDR